MPIAPGPLSQSSAPNVVVPLAPAGPRALPAEPARRVTAGREGGGNEPDAKRRRRREAGRGEFLDLDA